MVPSETEPAKEDRWIHRYNQTAFGTFHDTEKNKEAHWWGARFRVRHIQLRTLAPVLPVGPWAEHAGDLSRAVFISYIPELL